MSNSNPYLNAAVGAAGAMSGQRVQGSALPGMLTLEQMLAMRQSMRENDAQQRQDTRSELMAQPGMRQPYQEFNASQPPPQAPQQPGQPPPVPVPGADHIGSQTHQALLSGLRNYGKPRDY